MSSDLIYLDNNATTCIDGEVSLAMHAVHQERLANPASQHAAGRKARRILEEARSEIGRWLGCRIVGMNADQVILTSGGTEANNLAMFGLIESLPGELVVASIEHPSILGACEAIAGVTSRRVRYLPVNAEGEVDLATWQGWLDAHIHAGKSGLSAGRIAVLSVMLASNETGVIQPLAKITAAARAEGILVHTDAVQALGKIPLSFAGSQVDAMTVTAHKLHGPVGVGALVLRHGVHLQPRLHGGFQQLGLRPGTESVALAVGFATAIKRAVHELEVRHKRMAALREKLESLLLSSERPPLILGCAAPRLPHTIALAYPGIERQSLQMALDRCGIACSTGSACASGSGRPSHVLQAMRLSEEIIQSAIRLSLSWETTSDEIDEAAVRINHTVLRFPRSG